MDNNYLGDLADIVRASGNTTNNINTTTITTTTTTNQISRWNFTSSDTTNEIRDLYSFPDPLPQDINPLSTPTTLLSIGVNDNTAILSNITSRLMQVPAPAPNNHSSNLFSSKIVEISPHGNVNNPVKSSFGFMGNNDMMNINANCNTIGLEISSPRNSGMKRRKGQAKKVVCIPAPAAANSRQTGEVVPSDLWAWRKYGQKPIKGSPYPRGYYRCSSSKGCLARKQVERSRTNPNMLVITYTCEHNHPWPTQRNALAGSSRSHSSKSSSLQSHVNHDVIPSSSHKDEVPIKEETNNNDTCYDNDMDVSYNTRASTSTTLSSTKEEDGHIDYIKGNDLAENNNTVYEDDRLNNNYRPTITTNQTNFKPQLDQDFFKDLVEYEGDDPLNLLFTQETKESELFSGFFDWSQNIGTTHNGQDFEQNNDSSSA